MKKVILIAGEAEHGKDEVAKILSHHLDGRCISIRFAKHLKIIAKDYFGWDGNKDDKGRTLLQQLGTEEIRERLGWQTFHAQRTCEDIMIAESQFDFFFIPDLRFENEYYYVKAMFPQKVITVKVVRLGYDNGLTEEQRKHKTENQWKSLDYDYIIESENGIEKLQNAVLDVMGNFIVDENCRSG